MYSMLVWALAVRRASASCGSGGTNTRSAIVAADLGGSAFDDVPATIDATATTATTRTEPPATADPAGKSGQAGKAEAERKAKFTAVAITRSIRAPNANCRIIPVAFSLKKGVFLQALQDFLRGMATSLKDTDLYNQANAQYGLAAKMGGENPGEECSTVEDIYENWCKPFPEIKIMGSTQLSNFVGVFLCYTLVRHKKKFDWEQQGKYYREVPGGKVQTELKRLQDLKKRRRLKDHCLAQRPIRRLRDLIRVPTPTKSRHSSSA